MTPEEVGDDELRRATQLLRRLVADPDAAGVYSTLAGRGEAFVVASRSEVAREAGLALEAAEAALHRLVLSGDLAIQGDPLCVTRERRTVERVQFALLTRAAWARTEG